MVVAVSIERGCGDRVQGGIYSECGLSRWGVPLERFMLCPPVLVDAEKLGLSAVGVKLVPMETEDGIVYNVYDIVGRKYYPHVADMLEEMRRFGMSRRLASSVDFSLLDGRSKHYLLSEAAWIDDYAGYQHERIGGKAFGLKWNGCPHERHVPGLEIMCAGLWWEDVGRVERLPDASTRIGTRVMPSFTYSAAKPPQGVDQEHRLAIFAVMPIHRLAVVRADDGSHEKALDKARAVHGIPVDLTEE